MARLGLIAGEGELPAIVAENASRTGFEVVIASLSPRLDPRAAAVARCVYAVDLADVAEIAPILRAEGVTQAVMIGKVWRAAALDRATWRAMDELAQAKRDRADASMLSAFAEGLRAAGIVVLDQLRFLGDAVPGEGVLGRSSPTADEWEDVAFGISMARCVARAGIGQSVVVKDRAVLAVEAAEGTDEAIRRAGRMAPGCVVVKVSWPGSDDTFDIPTVGPDTVRTMDAVRARVLAVEAGRTIVVRRPDTVALADAAGIAVVAVRVSDEERGERGGREAEGA